MVETHKEGSFRVKIRVRVQNDVRNKLRIYFLIPSNSVLCAIVRRD